MEGTCMELALEGERLCKAGDCRAGVQFFEAGIQVGTDDLKTLSAIYSQLGNAYFYLQEYGKALEYHKHDLNLARTLGDRLGEAKASGNLGNTLKVLGKFDEAIACCERHLEISRELQDRIGEARALYNLGNVYHAKGKHVGRSAHQDPGQFPPDVKDSLQKAADYYEENLSIVRELDDRAAQGRACGNLGNTHYLLGNFPQAIVYHKERLSIAKEFGDKSAERRAYSNLGNAHIFQGEFEVAAEHFKKTLQIAKELGDKALEAQACYSLGNTYTLLRDYDQAVDFHLRHLVIAQELRDRVGEGRACWSLGNAHTALGNHEKALQYAAKHLEISKEIGDKTGQVTAQLNLADLRNLLGISQGNDLDSSSITESASSMTASDSDGPDLGARRPDRGRRHSMENMDIMKLTPDRIAQQENLARAANGGAKPKVHHRLEKAASVATEMVVQHETRPPPMVRPSSARRAGEKAEDMDADSFFDLLTKFQSRRIDDQRCSFRVMEKQNSQNGTSEATTPQADEFLDMVAGIQGSRMNDQRAALPEFPGLTNSQEGSRMEDQRGVLPTQSAPTVPDEDFFNLIQRVQSDRLDGQRTQLPADQKKEKKRPSHNKKKKDKK